MLMDEAYSHYLWKEGPAIQSAAAYVEDVEKDPIVILDGLTKNWRYPGWRMMWTLGPKAVIDAVASAGSFLDGGGCRPIQSAAAEIVNAEHTEQETRAIRTVFGKKRNKLLSGLQDIGVRFDREPEGTFYAWGDVSHLKSPFNTGQSFFENALKHKVITVPGEFFDVDPGQKRMGRPSRFRHHVRFSFGPEERFIDQAIERFKNMLSER